MDFWRVLKTEDAWDLGVVRVVAATVMLPHGWSKVAMFGEMVGILGNEYGLPAPVGVAVILVEFLAPLALLVGLGGRLASLSMAVVMAGAMSFHVEHGLMMNWFGDKAGEGFEYHLLFLAALLPVIVRGSGRLSVDGWLYESKLRS